MSRHIAGVADIEAKVKALLQADPYMTSTGAAVASMLTDFTNAQANDILKTWQQLLPALITKYHDGYVAEMLDQAQIHMRRMFYTPAWLDATGYWLNRKLQFARFIYYRTFAHCLFSLVVSLGCLLMYCLLAPNNAPGVIMFDPNTGLAQSGASTLTVIFTAMFSCLVTLLAGAYYLRSKGISLQGNGYNALQKNEYVSINL